MKEVRLSEDVVPIGEFKAHIASWIKRMGETGYPLVITQNGKPAGIIISPEVYDQVLKKEKFFNSITAGLSDAEAGRIYTTKELEQLLSLR